MKHKTPRPGAPRGNQNAAKPATDRRVSRTVRMSVSQDAALRGLGGTTSGLDSLLNAAAAAAPVVRTFQAGDGAWYAVWLDDHAGEFSVPDERETDAGAIDEYGARLIAAHEWLTALAHAQHMAMRATHSD
jgi:hypothetical protein